MTGTALNLLVSAFAYLPQSYLDDFHIESRVHTHLERVAFASFPPLLLPVVPQLVQQALPPVVPDGEVAAPGTEVDSPDVLERRLRRRPVAEDSPRRDVQQLEAVVLPPRRHRQYLPVGAELHEVGRRRQVHHGLERRTVRRREGEAAPRPPRRAGGPAVVQVDHAALGPDRQEAVGRGEGGGYRAVLVVEALDAPPAADVPPEERERENTS
ncbi:hypothetical protein THAOC_09310 [Thalassiosira oceanica]|uniref:Uncharacterized protein n=1 Tax=Thalassiosira oceanica TaxID=159749 RepID=K0SWU3_THAOC|nr:hypothetical protein THAOC_09310 [Thalassiosira oceanica]|eukprot:EJK69434.1 hypothetical protein THAOC_09310 [Thalassiosira oceanica]